MRDIIIQVLTPIAAVLGTVLAALLVALVKRVVSKAGVELGAEQEAALSEAAKRAVLATEEWAAKKIQATPNEKYEKAAESIKAQMPKAKLTPAKLDTHIHAAVAKLGMGAMQPKSSEPDPLPPPPKAGEQ